MLNSLDKALVRLRHQGTVDFDVFEQRERAVLYKFEECPKSGLVIPSCCECPHSFSFQERFFRPSQHIERSTIMRKRWCRRPDTARADFGTGCGTFSSLVSLSSSSPSGWPCTRATSRLLRVSADDQCICDSSRNCDPTSFRGCLQNVNGAQEP